MPVSIPQRILPAPSVSLSRTGATTATVSISNTGTYPSGCSLVINGTTYALSASTSITITMASTQISVYVAYSGSLNIAASSLVYSGTISQYKLPAPIISGTYHQRKTLFANNGTVYRINLDNKSEFPAETTFDVEAYIEYNNTFGVENQTDGVNANSKKASDFPLELTTIEDIPSGAISNIQGKAEITAALTGAISTTGTGILTKGENVSV